MWKQKNHVWLELGFPALLGGEIGGWWLGDVGNSPGAEGNYKMLQGRVCIPCMCSCLLPAWVSRTQGGNTGSQWTRSALNSHLFLGLVSSKLGQCQSPRWPDCLCCSPVLYPPAPHNMSSPALGLLSTWENMWQSFGKFGEIWSKHSQALSCAAKSAWGVPLPVVSGDRARPAWQRSQPCWSSAC